VLKLRQTWILWFTLLAIPGSGFLRFDGLPFSSKSEFAVIAVTCCVLFSSEIRNRFRSMLSSNHGQTKRWINTILIAAIILKFFTFVLAPHGDGFESCYRSIYSPPRQEVLCEKSFEAPFIQDARITGLDQITRMEPVINFGSSRKAGNLGASETTWRLPFVNEFPRFDAQWLDRFPFTAKFVSYIKVKNDSFIPVQFVGEISVLINDNITSAISYEQESIILIPVKKGTQKIQFDYKFADLEISEIPDRQPPIRGPWARLFVGKPIRESGLIANLTLNIRGWAINQDTRQAPSTIEIRNQADETIAVVTPSPRPDVAKAFGNKNYTNSGFDFVIPDIGLSEKNKHFGLFATYPDGQIIPIGKVSQTQNKSNFFTIAEIAPANQPGNSVSIDFATFSIDTNNAPPLIPAMTKNSRLTVIAFSLLDLLVFLGIFLNIVFLILALKRNSRELIRLLVLSLLSNLILTYLPFSWWGYNSTVIPIAIGLLIGYSLWLNKSLNLIGTLPGILAVVVGPTIYMARRFMGLADAPWWGFQLFRGRDSDWFVAQGYGRRIFIDASLNGGENLFYFQPATRYLVFIQHLLFGENDVLLGVLMGVSALTAVVFTARQALKHFSGSREQHLTTLFIVACFVMFTEQIFFSFAIAPSSEYPTWILIFVTFGVILRGSISQRAAIIATIMAALTAQFRPNQAIGALFLFLLVQSELGTGKNLKRILDRFQLLIVFTTTMSLCLIHNLYYGGEFVLFSVTGGPSSDFSYSALLNIFSDENARAIFVNKLVVTFNYGWPPSPRSLAFWALDLIWLLAVVRTIKLRDIGIKIWVVLIFPFAYFVPQIPYDFSRGGYHPRHVVAIQLAFGLSGLYVLSRQARKNSELATCGDDLQREVGHIGANAVNLPVN
jgi:hypothetical protein